jgi:F-type H+-transporting ATPase subunit b
MLAELHNALILVVGATEGAAGEEEDSGNFLVSPELGLMLWTLIAFGITYYALSKLAFPRIAEALDKRRKAIDESIESAIRTKEEADQLLEEYRARLKEAREQADDIVARSRKAGEKIEEESKQKAQKEREEMMERAKRDIDQETQRAIDEIRQEVAELTVMATERLVRKSLDGDDHRRLIEEALENADFARLSGAQEAQEEVSGNGRASGDLVKEAAASGSEDSR